MSEDHSQKDFDAWATEYRQYYKKSSRADFEFRFSRMLILASRRWTAYIDEAVQQETGHTRARWQTLFAIAFADEPVATLDLSERMGVQWPTLIRSLNDLETEGLIKRKMNPDDKRSRLVTITPKGRKALMQVKKVLDPLRQNALQQFTKEELATAENLLERLLLTVRQL
ncbi:MarR family winged helix-turn-helix transcriptional regulator [Hyphococcus luteus]|jgi:MarR family transcriptional regulator for hemolysin|uniref:HTH marR-type domain-containing protein n=1 Tax=Hyphococcus luteus TaxID=2058213 RepID=A0A2S7KAI1_9PROT|nr:MarR family winged helix-turn-helix transcriptional regulator [Marinicaulis flavus]PQA89497.1 hypothetical protein CW354_01080 [Marinicaulis flavus]